MLEDSSTKNIEGACLAAYLLNRDGSDQISLRLGGG